MSADNGIYILTTNDNHMWIDKHTSQNMFEQGIKAYRVAYAFSIDNIDWYIQEEPHNLGYCLHLTFGESKVHYNYEDAMFEAIALSDEIGYTEYGIRTIDLTQYNFPGS